MFLFCHDSIYHLHTIKQEQIKETQSEVSAVYLKLFMNYIQEQKLTRKKFHHSRLECKNKSKDTRSNKKVWCCSTKWNRAKANIVWPKEHLGHSQNHLSTALEMTLHVDITRW